MKFLVACDLSLFIFVKGLRLLLLLHYSPILLKTVVFVFNVTIITVKLVEGANKIVGEMQHDRFLLKLVVCNILYNGGKTKDLYDAVPALCCVIITHCALRTRIIILFFTVRSSHERYAK